MRGESETRFLIDAADRPTLELEALAWADVCGKVNRLSSVVPADAASKVLPIGPSFPCRIHGAATSWTRAIIHYVKARRGLESTREHFANWRRQYKYALPENAYQPRMSRDAYVFSCHSLWKADLETNRNRILFFESCRSIEGLQFEGGFTPRTRGVVPGYDGYTVARRYPIGEYVEKVRQSAVVFNTPAVFECHGVKLAEYLALGKAIISTALNRELPSPLVHGESVHFVDPTKEAMGKAIVRLLEDRKYRSTLERGARTYYCEYLRPRRVIERLLGASHAAGELARPSLR